MEAPNIPMPFPQKKPNKRELRAACLVGGQSSTGAVIHGPLENQNLQDLTSRARNNRAGWRRLRSTHKSFFPLLESHADSSEFPYQPLMARNEDLDKVVYPSQVLA